MTTPGWAFRLRRGFTLIELLIVITIIAILAMAVVPRVMAARRRAKEAQLRGNLKQLRDSIERFEANMGAWPPALSDIMAADGSAISADKDAYGVGVDRSGYDGSYLESSQLPKDPFTGERDWDYDPFTGDVHSRSTLTALDKKTTYNTW